MAKYRQHTEQARNVTNFWYVTWSQVPSTLSRYGVTLRGNVTSVYLPLEGFRGSLHFISGGVLLRVKWRQYGSRTRRAATSSTLLHCITCWANCIHSVLLCLTNTAAPLWRAMTDNTNKHWLFVSWTHVDWMIYIEHVFSRLIISWNSSFLGCNCLENFGCTWLQTKYSRKGVRQGIRCRPILRSVRKITKEKDN